MITAFDLLALTRNPRVDFISRRVEDIKAKKARVTALANTAKHQLASARKTLHELDCAMVEAFNDELGERKWDDEKGTYTRMLNPEERRLVSDMERVFNRCRDTMDKVVASYVDHLDETMTKPLTYNTPDEEARLATVMETKEEYKAVRTLYSDAMIDVDAELSTGSAPSHGAQARLDEAKKSYEQMSDRLCEDALRYERIYRDELAQRVSAHFLAEQHLLRGVATAMRDFMPYTKGLTLDWQEMRATRRTNLAAAKGTKFDDDEADVTNRLNDLPLPGSSSNSPPSRSQSAKDVDSGGLHDNGSSSSNPFSNIAADVQRKGSNAAAAISSAGKSASKNISDMVSSYGTKTAAKSTAKSMKSPFS